MGTQIWDNIGSGNGLLPDSTKPFTWTNVDLSSTNSWYEFENHNFEITATSPRANELTQQYKERTFVSRQTRASQISNNFKCILFYETLTELIMLKPQ